MRSFGKHKWWLLTVLLTVPLLAYGAGVPNVFKPGDVISSSQVNANFAALDTRLSALEAAVGAPTPNPWVKVGENQTKATWDTLIGMYPPDKYEWGISYNTPTGPTAMTSDGPGATVHRVTFSSWNGGVRIMTEQYLEGDGAGSDPPTGFWMGGAAWFYGTSATFDDSCTQAGAFKHLYWQLSGTGITMLAGNGCGGGTWYVRVR
jgi:hypothetical protein